ncbi:MAG TPA: hypothetical protein VNO70_26070 [Blastocatellia bacterium]|nr:hypothetical protein [Blastocatellia bacterium]
MSESLTGRQRKQIETMDTPDGHVTFLREQWKGFAAFAWKQYLAHGRGAVVIDFRKASASTSGIHLPTSYIAEGSDRLAKLGGWPSAEVAQLIHEYDPEQDVVFLVLRLNGEVFHYNASDEPPPPEA